MTAPLGPKLDLQIALVALWGADTNLKTLIGNPIRILPKQQAAWPGSYISVGQGQKIADLAECISGSEIFLTFDIWDRTDQSGANCETIIATMEDALEGVELMLTENRCLLVERERSETFRDPDGVTWHGTLTVRALTEPR